jgi:hypothetical protein
MKSSGTGDIPELFSALPEVKLTTPPTAPSTRKSGLPLVTRHNTKHERKEFIREYNSRCFRCPTVQLSDRTRRTERGREQNRDDLYSDILFLTIYRASLIIRFYEAGILPPKTASRSDLTDLVYCM